MDKFIHRGKNLMTNNQGQVLLIVVLTMIVALTVGLSIASRTILNLKLAKQNEESQRAFSAAEAGIEQALIQTQTDPISGSFNSGTAKYTTSIEKIENRSSFLLNGGNSVDQDAGIDVWLSAYPGYGAPITGTLTLYWNDESQINCTGSGVSVRSALEVVVLSGSTTSPTFTKYVFDPCTSPARTPNTDPIGAPGIVEEINFFHSAQITVTNGLIMKVIPVYNSSKVGILSSTPLPAQGSLVTSTGTSGETVRKILYFSSYPQIPLEIFPYSLISQ